MVEHPHNVYVIKQLELVLRPRFIKLCADVGMTAPQYTALTVLRRRPGITSSELARRSFVRAQTMAMTLEPLLDAGHVSREPDPTNGRRMRLFLTESGERAIKQLSGPLAELEATLTDGFTSEERDQFAELLRRGSLNLARAPRDTPEVTEASGTPNARATSSAR